MYHYLKWAAFSLFLKRNLRYLFFILIALVGIYGIDAVYQDLVDYAVATDQKGVILYLLLGKWVIVIGLSILLVYSIMKLGFSKEDNTGKPEKKKQKGKVENQKETKEAETDPVMQRLEKFRTKGRLKRRSDLVLERLEKAKSRK